MTRAEKWLIVCGIDQGNQKASWHQTVSDALQRAGAGTLETDFGEGLRYAFGAWPKHAENRILETKKAPITHLLDFGNATPKTERNKIITPSTLPGAKALGGEGLGEEDAKRRGRQIHLLLEHLPNASDPDCTARNLLLHGADAAPEADIPGLLGEAQNALAAHPDVFRPETLAEVSIVAPSSAFDGVVSGVIDRLVVTEKAVHAIDFKTNAVVPDSPEQTPDGILRQMGAYLEALENIYPDREIILSVLWTATGDLMRLPHSIVRSALQAPPTS